MNRDGEERVWEVTSHTLTQSVTVTLTPLPHSLPATGNSSHWHYNQFIVTSYSRLWLDSELWIMDNLTLKHIVSSIIFWWIVLRERLVQLRELRLHLENLVCKRGSKIFCSSLAREKETGNNFTVWFHDSEFPCSFRAEKLKRPWRRSFRDTRLWSMFVRGCKKPSRDLTYWDISMQVLLKSSWLKAK